MMWSYILHCYKVELLFVLIGIFFLLTWLLFVVFQSELFFKYSADMLWDKPTNEMWSLFLTEMLWS